jgi:AcrR family transcriptional regulator
MSSAPPTSDAAGSAVSVRDRLLNAAEVITSRDGVANLTLDAVAREAGVSKGGLLYHFPSKSALLTGIVERLASDCEIRQNLACAGCSRDPGSFTRAYLAARAAPPDPQSEPIRTALLAAVGTDPQYLEPMRRRFEEWQRRIESDGIDPAVATIVRLAIDGLCLSSLLGMPVPTGTLRDSVLAKLQSMTTPAGCNGAAGDQVKHAKG